MKRVVFLHSPFVLLKGLYVMNQPRLHLYTIDMKYVRNLSNANRNVMSTAPQAGKSNRPFVGILILLNNKQYCIPLTSPKGKFEGKKNSVDFMKILHPTVKNEDGAYKVIGALNINNMLPVSRDVLTKVDLQINSKDSPQNKQYKELMKDQLTWCQNNQDIILKRANRLYDIVTKYPEENRNLTRRCCNFKKLEAVLDRYLDKLQTNAETDINSENLHSKKEKLYVTRTQMNNNAKTVAENRSSKQPGKSKIISNEISDKKKDSEPR